MRRPHVLKGTFRRAAAAVCESLEARRLLSVTLSLSGPATVADGATYTLGITATSTAGPGTIDADTIDFGDGINLQGISGNPTSALCQYTEPGTYTITDIVSDNENGAIYSDIATLSVVVTDSTPSVSISSQGSAPTEGVAYVVQDSFSDPGGTTADEWTVSWGDGASDAYNADPGSFDHTYTEAGSYTIAAVAVADDSTYSTSLIVNVSEATATFSVSGNESTVSEGESYTVSPTFVDPGGDAPTSYTIAWGDGQNSSGAAAPGGGFTHEYHTAGTLSVTAVAVSEDGSYTAATSVAVTDPAPSFSVVGVGVATIGSTYSLTASFADAGGDTLSSYTVNWDDGSGNQSYSSGAFSHVYTPTGGGSYVVTTTGVNDDGTYTANSDVNVYAAGNGSLSVGGASPTEGTDFTLSPAFTETSDPTAQMMSWTVS